MATCPHCQSENSTPVTNESGWTTCASCSQHFQVELGETSSAAPASQVPIAMPVGATSPQVRPPHLDHPVEDAASNKAEPPKPKKAKRSPFVSLVMLPMIGFVLAGGLVLAAAFLWPPTTPGPESAADRTETETDPEDIAPEDIVLQPPEDPVAHKRLKLTRREFREKMRAFEPLYDANTSFNWHTSGADWLQAFGKPHADVTEGKDQKLYWHVKDGTIEVVVKPSDKPLNLRNSDDGSLLIVRHINDYHVKKE